MRSARSLLAYRRGARILTIQIQNNSLTGSDVDITVSPEGGGGGPAPRPPGR